MALSSGCEVGLVDHRLAMHGAEDRTGHDADRVRVAARIDAVLDRAAEIAVVEQRKAERQRQLLDRAQPRRLIGVGEPHRPFRRCG